MKAASGRVAQPLLECERGVCAAGHPREARAGAAMFESGGNAVDAAVAAAFVGFVVEQLDCGLGGFARVSVYAPELGRSVSFDGYVRAPAAARADMFEPVAGASTYYGHPPTAGERARYGALAPATPGAVAALCEAHAGFGRLPLVRVIEPAIEAAREGAPFSGRDVLAIARLADRIRALPDTAAALLPRGELPRVPAQAAPDRLDGAALAATLSAIAAGGAAAFYRGEPAGHIARAIARLGGLLDAADLAAVTAPSIRESPARYRDHRLTTCLDPIGVEALHLLDGFSLGELPPESFAARHLVAEALAVAFTDNIAHGGDPEFVAAPIAGLRSRAYADRRRRDIDGDRALPRPVSAGDPWPFDPGAPGGLASGSAAAWEGTSQMVAADAGGFMVAITTAVGWDYGSLVYVPEAGLFLNNGMSYFDPRPGRPNSIAPGKAPVFGAPTLVAWGEGGARLACAGSGGYRIQTAVLHAATQILDHRRDPEAALEHPRVHCQGGDTVVDARIAAPVIEALRAAGHRVEVVDGGAHTLHFGRACAVEREPATGVLRASASPHWMTGVAGV